MEYVYTVDPDLDLVVVGFGDVDVGFAKDDEEVAGSRVFEGVGHVEVGVHAGFEDRDPSEFGEVGGVGVVVEGTGDQGVESGISGFAGGSDQIGSGDGAKFGADEDSGAAFFFSFGVVASAQM